MIYVYIYTLFLLLSLLSEFNDSYVIVDSDEALRLPMFPSNINIYDNGFES